MSLYDLTLEAEESILPGRNPNIDEWCKSMDAVLKALHYTKIGSDRVTAINIEGGMAWITTTYCVRGCLDTNTVGVPLSILKAEDPVKEATLCHLKTELGFHRSEIRRHKNNLEKCTDKVQELTDQLAILTGESNVPT